MRLAERLYVIRSADENPQSEKAVLANQNILTPKNYYSIVFTECNQGVREFRINSEIKNMHLLILNLLHFRLKGWNSSGKILSIQLPCINNFYKAYTPVSHVFSYQFRKA